MRVRGVCEKGGEMLLKDSERNRVQNSQNSK